MSADEQGGAAPDSGQTSDAGAAIADVAGDMPSPQEHAIAAERADEAKRAEAARAWSGYTDKHGNSFDPAIHKTDANGEPILTKANKLSLKPGRTQQAHAKKTDSSPKSQLGGPAKSKSKPQTDQPETGASSGDPRAAGQMIAENIFFLGQLIGGPEWAPMEQSNPELAKQLGFNEREMQYEAWANYCEAKGISDVPPGLMVTLVMGQYVALRLSMPQTQTRFQRFKSWAARKVYEWRTKKRGQNARSDSGHDTKRQNERGETSGA